MRRLHVNPIANPMINHTTNMRGKDIWPLVQSGEVKLGGYRDNKIYGRLDCWSANRHLKNGTYQKSRVLFASEAEAIDHGYRPCAKCLPQHYKRWKQCVAEELLYTLEIANDVDDEPVEWVDANQKG